MRVLGACSVCGGAVVVPEIWHSVKPPIPTCERCGAVRKNPGPVIEMEPKQKPDPKKELP